MTDDRDRAIADLQRQVAVLEAEVRALRAQLDLVFKRLDRTVTDAIGRVRITGFVLVVGVLTAALLVAATR